HPVPSPEYYASSLLHGDGNYHTDHFAPTGTEAYVAGRSTGGTRCRDRAERKGRRCVRLHQSCGAMSLKPAVVFWPEMDYVQICAGESMANTVQASAGVASGPQRLSTDRLASANRRRLCAPASRTFVSIADLWGLTEEQRRVVLGSPSRSTFQGWATRAREPEDFTLDVDTLTR